MKALLTDCHSLPILTKYWGTKQILPRAWVKIRNQSIRFYCRELCTKQRHVQNTLSQEWCACIWCMKSCMQGMQEGVGWCCWGACCARTRGELQREIFPDCVEKRYWCRAVQAWGTAKMISLLSMDGVKQTHCCSEVVPDGAHGEVVGGRQNDVNSHLWNCLICLYGHSALSFPY